MEKFFETAVFVECSTGSTPRVKTLKKFIDFISAFGYDQLYLGLTDGYKIDGEPYFNFCRGGYDTAQLREIDAYAAEKGVELRVNIQTLAHLAYISRYDCYKDIMDTEDILMVGNGKAYALIDKMFAAISVGVRSRTIHIGMDEAWRLGLGRYLERNGYTDKRTLLLFHLNRVVEIARKYGYTCEMWSDMFYRMVRGSDFNDTGVIPEDVRRNIPEGVKLVHWRYDKQPEGVLAKQLRQNKAVCDDVALAVSAKKSIGLAPDNRYSIDTVSGQLATCKAENVHRVIVTLWSDAGAHCSIFSVLPTLFATSQIARGASKDEIDKKLFNDITGAEFDDFMLIDNLNNPFFKELDGYNNRCYWGLLSDLFLGSYDLLLSENSGEAYAALAERYAEIVNRYDDASDACIDPEKREIRAFYKKIFENVYFYARVLALKMNMGVRLRKAYREGDRDVLNHIAAVEIPEMIARMRKYTESFDERWLCENMGFGLEYHHLFYGGQVNRWRYVAKRVLSFLDNGDPIDELEREELTPSLIPPRTEDDLLQISWRDLIAGCGF